MDVVERYLSAIRSQLPDAQKADVTAELRDLLMSQVEEQEAALGRRLDRAETEALLKAFGHPLVVAGRYRRINQLIGPEVFPFYWFGLRTALAIMAVVQVIVGAVIIAASPEPGQAFGQLIGRLVESLILTVGWVTIAAVAVEQSGSVKHLHRWSLRQLPQAVTKPRKSRLDAAIEIGFTIVFIAWWTGWAPWSGFVVGGEGIAYAAGPMREPMQWPVLALAIVGLGIGLVELVRPGWSRLTAGLGLAWNLAALAMLAIYVRGGPLVEAIGDAPAAQLARVEHGANVGLSWVLAVIGAIMAWEAIRDAWWLLRGRAADAAPRQPARA